MSNHTILALAVGVGALGLLVLVGGVVGLYLNTRTYRRTDTTTEGNHGSKRFLIGFAGMAGLLACVVLAGVACWGSAGGWLPFGKVFSLTDTLGYNSPERVAQRFLSGEFGPDDLASDSRYEIDGFGLPPDGPFEEMWSVQLDPRAGYKLEIHDIVVRDSLRPNSKEVTILYSERYNQLMPPWYFTPLGELTSEDTAPVPVDQWQLTGEHTEHRWYAAFLIVERQEGRWVVWCAEIEPDVATLPDKCSY